MKKLFIFDFDGTLFNTKSSIIKYFNMALEDCGLPKLNKNHFDLMITTTVDEGVPLVLGDNATKDNILRVKRVYRQYYLENRDDFMEVFDGVHDVLRKLQKRGVLLAINSNARTSSVVNDSKKCLGDVEFISIRGDDEYSLPKPNPSDVLSIMELAGVSCSETVYIGDTYTDYLTAKNAGVDFVFVDWGYGDVDKLDGRYVSRVVYEASDLFDLVG